MSCAARGSCLTWYQQSGSSVKGIEIAWVALRLFRFQGDVGRKKCPIVISAIISLLYHELIMRWHQTERNNLCLQVELRATNAHILFVDNASGLNLNINRRRSIISWLRAQRVVVRIIWKYIYNLEPFSLSLSLVVEINLAVTLLF